MLTAAPPVRELHLEGSTVLEYGHRHETSVGPHPAVDKSLGRVRLIKSMLSKELKDSPKYIKWLGGKIKVYSHAFRTGLSHRRPLSGMPSTDQCHV